MVKKVLFMMLLIICLILNSQIITSATQVQIYDQSINNVLNGIRNDCDRYGTANIWGIEYYTYEGAKRCEFHFGDTDNNLVRFRLNNDNSVSRVLISIPNSIIAKDGSRTSYNQASFINGSIFKAIGLSESESKDIFGRSIESFKEYGRTHSDVHHYHEKFSVWCSKTNRYIVLDVEMDDSKFDWYIYAYVDGTAKTTSTTRTVSTADVKTEYWNGDTNCPIWVARDDGSMIAFKVSTARELDTSFTEGRKLIMFDVYDIESNGNIIEHPIGPNGGYGLLYNSSSYVVFYPNSRRFPDGQQIDIENPYQIKICKMLINESKRHDKLPMKN